MSGVTNAGFVTRRQDDIAQELTAAVRTVFGDAYNTDPSAPGGQAILILSTALSQLWQAAQAANTNCDIDQATGAALRGLVKLANTTAREASATTVAGVVLTGSTGTVIPRGSRVRVPNDIELTLDAEVTIGASGTVTGSFTAVSTGPNVIAEDTVTQIATPIAGWLAVNNPNAGTTGQDAETDAELRVRARSRVEGTGRFQSVTLRGALLQIAGVTHVRVLNNNTDATSAEGVPARTFETIVQGGTDLAVATAILNNTPFTVASSGSDSVTVQDEDGFNVTVRLKRPDPIDIRVEVSLTINSEFPATGVNDIKQAVVDYAQDNFAVNEEVVYSRLYTPINSIRGHQVDTLTIAIAGNTQGTANIPIGIRQISRFTLANVIVTTA